MPLIRVNRESVDDRFSVLGFTVRTESPLFEVGIATEPALFRLENRSRRSRHNFYSSRAIGAIRARRGEAVYLVPPDVLANFVGQPKLYFGLATYREESAGVPDYVQMPTEGHMYVDLRGLTERGLRRLAGRTSSSGAYGGTNGHDPSLDWGGDAQPQLETKAGPNGNGKAAAAPTPTAAPTPSARYDDGFGDFTPPKAAPAPSGNGAAKAAPAPAVHATAKAAPASQVAAQALARRTTSRQHPKPKALAAEDFTWPATLPEGNYLVKAFIEAYNARIADGVLGSPAPDPKEYSPSADADSRARSETLGRYIPRMVSELQSDSGPQQVSEAILQLTTAVSMQVFDQIRDRVAALYQGPGEPLPAQTPNVVLRLPAPTPNVVLPRALTYLSRRIGTFMAWVDIAIQQATAETAERLKLQKEKWEGLLAGVDAAATVLGVIPDAGTAIAIIGAAVHALIQLEMPNFGREYASFDAAMRVVRRVYTALAATVLKGLIYDALGQKIELVPPLDSQLMHPDVKAFLDAHSAYALEGWEEELAFLGYAVGGVRAQAAARGQAAPQRAWAQEIITPFYDPADPASALTCQADAFNQTREAWFAGVPNTRIFPHSAICLLEIKDGSGAVSGYGTGFYIGANRILTCGHNLRNAASVDVIPACNDTEEPFGRFNVTSANWRIPSSYDGGGDYDLAVIDNVPSAAPGGVWFDNLEELNQSRPEGVVVCGYSRKSDRVPELTQAMNGRMQHLHGGYIAQLRGEVFDYPILTLHRASGSPVYYLSHKDGTMKAYVVGVHISGEIAATQNLNTGCRLTEVKIAWIEGRTSTLALAAGQTGLQINTNGGGANAPEPFSERFHPAVVDILYGHGTVAQSLSAQSFSLHWDDTPYQPQSTESSCWAAAAAMVAGWRDSLSIPDSEIAAHVPAVDAYRNGLPPSARRALADAWNLVAEPPASYTIEAFRQMLADYGPLYVGMNWDKQGGGHARVLVGMESGGTEDGSDTTMFLYDPWPGTPGRIRMSFKEFVRLYEGRISGRGGTVDVQILHADSAHGRTPAAAAPFALSLAAAQVRAPGERKAAAGTAAQPVRAPQRGGTRALGADTIEYPVQLVPQPNKLACWTAAMAMLLSFRRNASYRPETLAAEVGGSLMTSYGWDLLQAVRDRYGFTAIEMPSNGSLYFTAGQWAQWLRDFGPLWVVIVGMPHAVVISGLRGNTDDPNACEVRLLNPWDMRVTFDDDPVEFHPANAGYADWLPFQQFVSDFGNMAEPDYGNWRVLHLPAEPQAPTVSAAPAAQGLLARAGAARSSRSRNGYLAQPPRPVRAQSLEDAPLPDEPIEPSRVAGSTMRRKRGNRGRVTWALDQLDGVKQSDPAAAMVPALMPTTITLDRWPYVGADPVPLPLTVRFDAGGGAVGNVRISAGTTAELPYDVTVTATIEDDPRTLPGASSPQAALRVTIDYDFSGTPNGDASARIKLRLVGNGRYDLDSAWQ
jgi:V8-like Glu-specific endopeptidase